VVWSSLGSDSLQSSETHTLHPQQFSRPCLLFGVGYRLVLQLGRVIEVSAVGTRASLLLILTAVFVAIGTAIAAVSTALAALISDRTTKEECPKVLSVEWGMRLVGVLFGSVLVNQVFGDACAAGASTRDAMAWLERWLSSHPLCCSVWVWCLSWVWNVTAPVQRRNLLMKSRRSRNA